MLSKFIAFCILTTSLFSNSHLVDVDFSIVDIVVVAGALLLGLAGFWGIKRGLELAEIKNAERAEVLDGIAEHSEYLDRYENNVHFEIEEDVAKIEELREERKAILEDNKILFSVGEENNYFGGTGFSSCKKIGIEENSIYEELQEEIKRIDNEINEVYQNSSCIDILEEYSPRKN